MHKKTILATLLAAAVSAAFSADYYVVVPLQGKQQLISGISVVLNSTTLPAGVVGLPYAGFDLGQALQVTGDPAYISTNVGWSVVTGELPAGLTLAKGVISGTPTAAGEQTFSVRATYKTKTGEQVYKILNALLVVGLVATTLPQGIVGYDYPAYDLTHLLTVTGDPAFQGSGVAWSLESGALPAGLSLTPAGGLTGAPTAAATSTFSVKAAYRDKFGVAAYQVITVNLAVSLASAVLPNGGEGSAYVGFDFKPLLAVTGDPAYNIGAVTWSIASGGIPPGLTLNSNGTLSGIPTNGTDPAGKAFAVKATYRAAESTQNYKITAAHRRILSVSPAVAGKTSWNLDTDGPLVLNSAGAWTITSTRYFNAAVKLWGGGGGAGGLNADPNFAGNGGGGGYVAGALAVSPATITVNVGGGGYGGLSMVSGTGGGAGGYNGGGAGGGAGAYGASGGAGGGGGRTELSLGGTTAACAGGGGGGGGDGHSATNGPTDGNSLAGYSASATGASAPQRLDDGGGNGGGGGGCPYGGAASVSADFNDSNGFGGAPGGSVAPGLAAAIVTAPGVSRFPANSGDADNGANGYGGVTYGNAGASGRVVIQ